MMCAKSEVKRGTGEQFGSLSFLPIWRHPEKRLMAPILHLAINKRSILSLPTWTKHDESICIITHCSKYLAVSEKLLGPQTVQLYQVWCLNEQWTWWPSPHIHNHCTMWLTVWGKLLRNCNKLLYLLLHYIVMMIPITCYQKYLVMETVI